jgi:hypothetical protein
VLLCRCGILRACARTRVCGAACRRLHRAQDDG